MSTAHQIEQLLDNVAKDVEKKKRQQEIDAPRGPASSGNTRDRNNRSRRDRSRSRDRDNDRFRDHRRDPRDRSRDRHRDRSRDRGFDSYNRNSREFNDERNRSQDGDRRRRDNSRPTSPTKDTNSGDEGGGRRGGRRPAGDYYSGRGARSRSRSRSPRRRDDTRSSYRGDRDRRRDDDRRYNGRRSRTPEMATEDDRDKRTVFVQQISQRAKERDLEKFFAVAGEVVEAQVVRDRVNGRSKGVGYVEFRHEDSVPKALELTGQKLKTVPIIVQLTEAEKNRVSKAAAAAEGNRNNGNNSQAPFHRLYVGNIHFSVTEDDLHQVFGPYGELEEVQLQKDETAQGPPKSRGYGFIQFRDPSSAKAALEQMNGFELANRNIRVGLGNDKFTPESTAQLLRNFGHNAQNYQGSSFSGAGGRGHSTGGHSGNFERSHTREERGVNSASALDDSDALGVSYHAVDRHNIMMKLRRDVVDQPDPARTSTATPARTTVLSEPKPGRCIKLQNMFSSYEEENKPDADPNWPETIKEEVKHEVVDKYGPIVHISVDANSDGDIYVKFEDTNGSLRAYRGLNGRRFNGQVVTASYLVDHIYHSMFPQAANR